MAAQILRLFAVTILGVWMSTWAAPAWAAKESIQFRAAGLAWYNDATKEIKTLQEQGRLEDAQRKNAAVLERVKQEFGPESFETAVVLSLRGHIYSSWNKPAEAASSYGQSLQLMEKLFGPIHAQVAIMQANLALAYGALNRTDEANALFEKAMEAAARASGEESDTLRQVLGLFAGFNANHADKIKARAQYERLAWLTRKVSGPDSTELISAQTQIAALLAVQKSWDEMDAYVTRTLDEAAAEHGQHSTFTIQLMADIAKIYKRVGRNEKTENLYRRIITLSEQELGHAHQFTVTNRVLLADALQNRGADREAIPLYAQALTDWEKAFGKTSRRDHDVYLRYGDSLRKLSQFGEAEQAFLAAIKVSEEVLGKLHAYNVKPQIRLAGLYKELGRYREAEVLYKTALDTDLKLSRGEPQHEVALLLDNIAVFYLDMGQPEEAEKYAKQSLEMFEKLGGPNDTDVVYVLNNLSSIYKATGRTTEALTFLTRALDIVSQMPKDMPFTGILLDNMANVLADRGKLETSAEFRAKAYDLLLRIHGKDSGEVALAAHNLGSQFFDFGDYTKAEEWYTQALQSFERIYGRKSRLCVSSLLALAQVAQKQGNASRALQLLEEALGTGLEVLPADHPDLIGILTAKGGVHWERGEVQGAYDAYRHAAAIAARRRGEKGAGPVGEDAYRGLIQTASKLDEAAGAEHARFLDEAFAAAQRTGNSQTSIALAQMSARFAAGSDALAQLVRKQQDLNQQFAANEGKLANALPAYGGSRDEPLIAYLRAQSEKLTQELALLDGRIRQSFPSFAELSRPQPLAARELQQQLAENEVLIQYLTAGGASYVWVIGKNKASWRRLAVTRDELQRQVAALRCGLEESGWQAEKAPPPCEVLLGRSRGEGPPPFDLVRTHQLYQAILAPFEKDIANKHLFIVPSGALSGLPLQVLLRRPAKVRFAAGGREHAGLDWLGASNSITILPAVSSLRALRQFARASTAPEPYTGYGDPRLTGSPACPNIEIPKSCNGPADRLSAVALGKAAFKRLFRSGEGDVIAVSSLCPLPDTAHELRCVAQRLGAAPATVHTGIAASETRVKEASATGELGKYRIVHFATHGLLAGETQMINKALTEPALILSPPETPSPADDGLLTASEVAQLRLNADWVVLSACNTAGGDRPGAEALTGLARAFFYAGARALLVSHWPVNSNAAVKLTTGAFSAMQRDAKIGRGEALRRSITALIRHGEGWEAHPSYWAPFAVVGEGGR
jgi:CHAT domain-containing protein/tetratricopeptide (TPR) repeat protein